MSVVSINELMRHAGVRKALSKSKAFYDANVSKTPYGREMMRMIEEDLIDCFRSLSSGKHKVFLYIVPAELMVRTALETMLNTVAGETNRFAIVRNIMNELKVRMQLEWLNKYSRGKKAYKDNIVEWEKVKNQEGGWQAFVEHALLWRNAVNDPLKFPHDDWLSENVLRMVLFIVHHPYSPFEPKIVYKKGKRVCMVQFKVEALEWMRERRKEWLERSPFYCPMVEKPNPWESMLIGGYDMDVSRTQFIKTKCTLENHRRNFRDYKPAVDTANYLMRRPFYVDRWLVGVVRELYDNKVKFSGFPEWERIHSPAYKKDEDGTSNLDEIRRVAAYNHDNRIKREELATSLVTHEMYEDSKIYLPLKSCYRGRIYTICNNVDYQGGDIKKAAVKMPASKAMDESADKWLKIHIANVWGNSKVSHDERIKWVEENRGNLERWASKPSETFREWGEASEPWRLLAAAKEFTEYMKKGSAFKHSLAVGMDGSNNGLQILSALSGDMDGLIATNVLPSDTPQDIYKKVLKKVEDTLAADTNRFAKDWLEFGLDRDLVKKPTMVLPYGGTTHGVIGHLDRWMLQKSLNSYMPFCKEDMIPARLYLAKIVHQSALASVPKSIELLKWFRQYANVHIKEGVVPTWKAPSGFVVKVDPVTLVKNYSKYGLVAYEGSTLDTRRIRKALAPNAVHSVDAAILHTVVARKREDEVLRRAPLSSVHDCYNTTAPYAQALNELIRECFVQCVSSGFIEGMVESACQKGLKKVNLPTIESDVDPSLFLESKYMYS